ncbi:MAG: NnrU family protein [Ancalomicrobiaceae bacterium]|nr:NnrU family protein [Ancalomicrobiaceae bacterium]
MLILLIGLVIFFAVHSLSIIPGGRAAIAGRIGDPGTKAVVGILSLIGLVLIVWGVGAARAAGGITVLWTPPAWTRHITFLLMLPVFPLLIAAYVPGRIRSTVKHPMITAVKVWAFAHLLSNGTLMDVLLFGAFLVWGVADRISLKRRGAPNPAPVAVFTTGDWVAVIAGLVLYGLMLWRGHLLLIGVPLIGPM